MEATEVSPVQPYMLRSIYLRKSSTRFADNFDPTMPGQPVAGIFRNTSGLAECRETEVEINNERMIMRSCAFTTRFDFAYTRPDETNVPSSDEDIEKRLVAQITAEITVDYLFNATEFPDAEALQKWGSTNVLLHAWPYWRELCHSTLLRMNLPVTIMPLVVFPNEPK